MALTMPSDWALYGDCSSLTTSIGAIPLSFFAFVPLSVNGTHEGQACCMKAASKLTSVNLSMVL